MELITLEQLLSDKHALPRLESLISTFNVFEALGSVRRELRHSDFIGFLYDPSETHGLDTVFYKMNCESLGIILAQEPVISVAREWENIDILVRDRANKIIIAIENKIDTSEHSNQLQRYRAIVESTYPDHEKYYVYLTKTGEEPSDKHWSIMSYGQIRSFVKTLASNGQEDDVTTILKHYADMIERHFMPNNEIAELCRQIYSEHRRAIDLIIEHRPEGGEDIFDKGLELVERSDILEIDDPATTNIHRIRFAVKAWDAIPGMNTSVGWTNSGRVLLFEIQNDVNDMGSVRLKLFLGPTKHEIRESLLECAKEYSDVFRPGKRGEKWMHIYNKELLSSDDMEQEDRLMILESNWNHFLKHDLPLIQDALSAFLPKEN